MIPTVTNTQARHLLLHRQGLCLSPTAKITRDGVLDIIQRMGFVQVDSIKTVERAHHMILLSRNQTYRPHLLKSLLEEDRQLFENWTHDASIIPSAYYPYWRNRFKRHAEQLRSHWKTHRDPKFESELERVLRFVADNGPVFARELSTKRTKASTWWDWHPSKTALEYHWRTGKLAVCHRRGFQKAYNLSERVIPAHLVTQRVSERQFIDWACASALERLGAATTGEIAKFWGALTPTEVKAWCQKQPSTRLIPVNIQSADGSADRAAFADPNLVENLAKLPPIPRRLRVINPFDPVIRDRKRCLRLFGFDYRIEVFVPEAKRRFGYYVFPLLEGDRFVGRINMKVDRDRDALVVLGLWPEPRVAWTRGRGDALARELNRIRRYLPVGQVCHEC